MKTLKWFFIAVTLLASCAKVEGPNGIQTNNRGEYAIVLRNVSSTTKASVSAWDNYNGYDKFQLFAWNDDEAIMNPFQIEGDGSINNDYKYEGIGSQELQYFRNTYNQYEFIGIIPNDINATLTNNSVLVSNVESFAVDDKRIETDIVMDSPKEFLYAYTNVEKVNYGSKVTLPFIHANALLKISFESDRDDTQLIDYTPYNPGTPGIDAWDETITIVVYSMTATTVPTLGPTIVSVNISDEDIAYINSKYTASKGFENYQTNNTITGNLDENMWEYLLSKYPSLSTIDTSNWASYIANSNMRLIHIDKTGKKSVDNDSYKAVFVNVQNVNWNAGTTTQTTIHHDAVPEVPATGIQGIRVFSADLTSDGHYIHKMHTLSTDAIISSNDITYNNRIMPLDSSDVKAVIPFALPETTTLATEQWSPTTFYAIPGDSNLSYFVVKFSYIYDNKSVYDVRVPLKLTNEGLLAGKYYHYIINITSNDKGTNNPNDAEDNKNEIDVINNPIIVNITVTDYTQGVETHITI